MDDRPRSDSSNAIAVIVVVMLLGLSLLGVAAVAAGLGAYWMLAHSASPARPMPSRPSPPNAPSTVKGLKLRASGELEFNGRALAAAELQGVLRGEMLTPDTVFTIEVEDDATQAMFARVVQVCQESGIEHFAILAGGEDFSFDLPLAAPDSIRPESLPPLTIRLMAGPSGELTAVYVNDRPFASVEELQGHLVAIVGTPASGAGFPLDVRLIADPNLRLKHLVEAWRAASYVRAADGSMAMLATKVNPFPQPHSPDIDFANQDVDLAGPAAEMVESLELSKPDVSLDAPGLDTPLAAPIGIAELEGANLPDGLSGLEGTGALAGVLGARRSAFDGRQGGKRAAMLAERGGTRATEEAVQAALKWLKKNQRPDGTWSLVGPFSGAAQSENKTSATALAILAFQGAGNTPKDGPFRKEVAKAWSALMRTQGQDGLFQPSDVPSHRLYAQAQATIALCEVYGMTKDQQFREPAQRAINYAVNAQDEAGGWRYIPKQDSDTSVTGWVVMALQSGRMAGLEVPQSTLDRVSKYLDAAALQDGARYGYQPGTNETPTMTAEALVCRQYLGWKQDDPRLVAGMKYVSSNPIDWRDQNVYYWYYATQAAFHREGEDWHKWNSVLREILPEHQEKSGQEAGSWSPQNDRWGGQGGRLFTTCLCTYMLEVYYRHPPVHKHPAP